MSNYGRHVGIFGGRPKYLIDINKSYLSHNGDRSPLKWMLWKVYAAMDSVDFLRKCKRFRKAFILLTIIVGLIIYLGPYLFRWTTSRRSINADPLQRCLSSHLELLSSEASKFDASIKYDRTLTEDDSLLPFVGNGFIGVVIQAASPLYIMTQRVLSLPVPFYPIVLASLDDTESTGATVIQYTSGVIQRFECIKRRSSSVDISYRYYTHRVLPSLLVQDIRIVNPTDEDVFIDLIQTGPSGWTGVGKVESRLNGNGVSEQVVQYSGQVRFSSNHNIVAVVIVQTVVPSNVQVKSQGSTVLHIVTSIHYGDIMNTASSSSLFAEMTRAARKDLERGLSLNYRKLREDHTKVWNQLWGTGLSISYSKAADALNGDKINATIYYILSHTRSPLYETDISDGHKYQLQSRLNQPDHCYLGHHTLQASKLWSQLTTTEEVTHIVSLWKLTLEKQGCSEMMQAGADGIMQALVLSFGGFKFSNHHLEFNMQPKYLHRDYLFRRISYGNGTHLNISVVVGENNKALLYVVLDRSDKNYYACDGGCLDPPVQLSEASIQFPVKMTDPPTAILYITSNKEHMEDLKHTTHVKEVIEAPAHEHHVLALHRHGHHFGGLPTMFWVSITFLVAIFHLFLFKLIYNEYCNSSDKFRTRHSM